MRASAHPTLLLRLTWIDVDVVAKATSEGLVSTRRAPLHCTPHPSASAAAAAAAQPTNQCVALRLPCKRESCYTPLLGRVAATLGEDAHGRANARLHERNDKRVPAKPIRDRSRSSPLVCRSLGLRLE
ncbi:uncharacterized protein PSANT_01884 [Moesziomyces antarcticus]|uniref:Uncharacterized protein n=1 Tax=Pseudozyma antarctica TaxID=84753 RepID=A0A5C3FL89_PSEA2|nr:uncharacterized protein PSANT_01884 [Moesziomyces antarcticus]